MSTLLKKEIPRRISRPELLNIRTHEISEGVYKEVEKLIWDALKCCICCRYWSKHRLEHCDLYNSRPPAAVIAFGCDSFKDIEEECPF